jgi:hypothetical protein
MIDKNASNTSLPVGYESFEYVASGRVCSHSGMSAPARVRRPAARGPAPGPPLPASLSPQPNSESEVPVDRPIRGIYVQMYTFTYTYIYKQNIEVGI